MLFSSADRCVTLFSIVKKRKKKIDVGKEARRIARNSGIAPSATRVIPDKRKQPPKHRKQWLETELE
jgi:hypothetical protein